MIARTEGALVAVAMVAATCAVLSAYAVRVSRLGRPVNPRLDAERGTVLLGRYPIEAFHWALSGMGRGISKTSVSPDTLTHVSLVLSLATIPLIALGHFALGGALLALGSAFDAFDGIVARGRGVASDAGEMLDAVVDRYADAACLIGLVFFYRHEVLPLAITILAVVGSMMVSYVRAKAETFHLSLPQGIMRRPERIAYLCGALVFGPLVSSWIAPADTRQPITLLVVLLIGVLS